jgi:hypothetical protein
MVSFLGTFDEKQAVHENSTKVETLVEYLKAQYLDEAASAKLVRRVFFYNGKPIVYF